MRLRSRLQELKAHSSVTRHTREPLPMKKLLALPIVLAGLVLALGLSGGCSSPISNRNPVGETFPSIVAEPLDAESKEDRVRIPEDFSGKPLLLLVGYVQDTQFDIDRWLFGALDADLNVELREVPAARGMGARLASGFIDGGMRRGIPKAEWGAVTTTYGPTAESIAEVTGTESPRNARVILLDGSGVIRWFHDQGFSAGTLIALREALAKL